MVDSSESSHAIRLDKPRTFQPAFFFHTSKTVIDVFGKDIQKRRTFEIIRDGRILGFALPGEMQSRFFRHLCESDGLARIFYEVVMLKYRSLW